MSTPERGAAYWLWEESQAVERSIADLRRDIEKLEAELVAKRTRLADLTLVGIEMKAAQGIIEQSGLKVEMRDDLPHVSVDRAFVK